MNEIVPVQLVLHGDEDIPRDSSSTCCAILRQVRAQGSLRDGLIEKHATAVCGRFPPPSQTPCRNLHGGAAPAGHPLPITRETAKSCRELCDQPTARSEVQLMDRRVWPCSERYWRQQPHPRYFPRRSSTIVRRLESALLRVPCSQLVTTVRQFPGHMRADVQAAIDRPSPHRSGCWVSPRTAATKRYPWRD